MVSFKKNGLKFELARLINIKTILKTESKNEQF